MKHFADDVALKVDLGLGGMIRIGRERIAVAEASAMLEAIAQSGSVQGVASELSMSYRGAWERLRTLEAALGRQLVKKTRGHGSVLTETGIDLREALAAAAAGLSDPLARETRSLQVRLAKSFGGTASLLTIAASHDLLLMEAFAEWGEGEVAVAGSEEAVSRLAEGRADAAGFHCGPLGPVAVGAPFADLVDNPSIVLRRLFEREQGLLLAPGNPLGIAGLADLPEKNARYVNRQKGSGTRVWFDRLLAEHAISAASIRGYGTEEFTHQAVAAVIAYGAADAGLGARSAAARFGLDFLAVGWEGYYLAASASLPSGSLDRLVAMVALRAERTDGYRLPGSPQD